MAGAAEDGRLAPFRCRPKLNGMVGEGVVAIFTGVENAAALHLYGDNVEGKMVVGTTGLRVEIDAVDVFSRFLAIWAE